VDYLVSVHASFLDISNSNPAVASSTHEFPTVSANVVLSCPAINQADDEFE